MSRIIAVDDDFALRRIYSEMLDKLGHEAVICADGQEALNAFSARPADLVILDINMPVLDGLETCRRIRRLPAGLRVPIIVVSSNDSEEDIAAGFNAGANDYMVKPLRETVLIAKLKNFLKTASLYRHEFDLVKNHVVFLDRYQIEKVLGYGTHSVVFLAKDKKENREVAVKLLNANICNDAILQVMENKVAQIQSVSSSRLIKIIDYGQHNGQIYLILEYAAGGDLKRRLTLSHLSEKEAIDLGLDMVTALAHLNDVGLCHLDLKPENILLTSDGYKLADFGLVTPRQTETMPLHGELWSTIAYAAPENFTAVIAGDVQSDVYSLGVTIYESVTGDNPFLSDKPTLTMFRQLNLTPAPIVEMGSAYSYEFSDLIDTMMRKSPRYRPSLSELHECFDYFKNCYKDAARPMQLNYPEAKKKELPHEATVKAPVKQKTKLPKAGGRPALLDRIGQKAYNIIQQRESGPRYNYKIIPLVLGCIVCVGLFNFVGQNVYNFFTDDKVVKKANLPIVSVRCFNCGNLDIVAAADIKQIKCSKCRGKVGYAMTCEKCHHGFPWSVPEDGTKDLGPKQLDELIAKSRICPSCHSSSTVYLSPAADAGRKGGK